MLPCGTSATVERRRRRSAARSCRTRCANASSATAAQLRGDARRRVADEWIALAGAVAGDDEQDGGELVRSSLRYTAKKHWGADVPGAARDLHRPHHGRRRRAAAIVIADAVLWHGAEPSLAASFAVNESGRDLLGRALIFRMVAEQLAAEPRDDAHLDPYRRVLSIPRELPT